MIERPRLAPCPGCRRHLRVDEVSCPFCGAALPAGELVAPSRRAPPRTLGRAALFAFGSAIASSASGCYLSHERDAPVIDAGSGEEPDGGGAITLYGTAPIDAAIDEHDVGAPVTHYGGPWPLGDGGFVPAPVDDAGPLEEVDGSGGSQVLYGGPPDEG